jgi:hypothetical protein
MNLPLGLRLHPDEREMYGKAIECMETLISSLLENPEICEYMLNRIIDLDCHRYEFICLLNNPPNIQEYISRQYLDYCYNRNINSLLEEKTLGKKGITIKEYFNKEILPEDFWNYNSKRIHINDVFEKEVGPIEEG